MDSVQQAGLEHQNNKVYIASPLYLEEGVGDAKRKGLGGFKLDHGMFDCGYRKCMDDFYQIIIVQDAKEVDTLASQVLAKVIC